MGRFGHKNGPFWMLAGAVFGLVFLPLGPFSVGAVLVCVGRFRPSLGPFWRWAVLVGSRPSDGRQQGAATGNVRGRDPSMDEC